MRQLKDWKYPVPIYGMGPKGMTAYGRTCGWTLAHAHARSGDHVAIAAYLGSSETFDHAIAEYAETHAEQNERDYTEFSNAVKRGRGEAVTGI